MKTTKILTGIGILVAFSFLTAVFVTGILMSQNNQKITNDALNGATNSNFGGNNTGANNSGGVTLNLAEVAKHNTSNNCWLLISGKIYNVTSFLPSHPGEAQSIIQDCGKDATLDFDTKGGQGNHSQTAQSMLTDYYIGDLGTIITDSNNATKVTPQTNPIAPPNTRREDDEEDDDD